MGFENLTEDVKAKAMDCETVEELERLAEEKGGLVLRREGRGRQRWIW